MANIPVTPRRIIVYLIIVAVVFLAGLEGALRITSRLTGIPMATVLEPDPVLHHRWVPGLNVIDHNRSVPYRIITNHQSWVGREDVSPEKPRDTLRIVFLGDSNTQGVVDAEDKMAQIVAKRLNEIGAKVGTKVETINTGTSSYAILQYHLLARKICEYSPDVVVINVDMTDVADDAAYRPLAELDGKGEITGIAPEPGGGLITGVEGHKRMAANVYRALSSWSFLIRTIGMKIYVYQTQPQTAPGSSLPRAGGWLTHVWTPETEKDVAYSMSILARTLAFLREKGVKCYVTSVPHYPQFTGEWSSRPHEVVAEAVRRNGGLYMDLFKALKESGIGPGLADYYWKEDPTHFNKAGNRAFADVHTAFLLDPAQGLLPQSFYGELLNPSASRGHSGFASCPFRPMPAAGSWQRGNR